ncbi:MAG: nitroreductase family protein [Clostridia bacterium]|nr:nitroreductase family protein [Clostridia bacterium]
MNDTVRSILDRRSNRGYEDVPVTAELLEMLRQCAVASPTAVNAQEWHFTFVTDKALLTELETAACEVIAGGADKERAKRIAERGNTIFYGAPMVVFISCDKDFKWSAIDAGIAVENLALAAHSMELGSVIIGMIDKAFESDKAKYFEERLCFPENYGFQIALAVGKPSVTKEAHPVREGKISIVK